MLENTQAYTAAAAAEICYRVSRLNILKPVLHQMLGIGTWDKTGCIEFKCIIPEIPLAYNIRKRLARLYTVNSFLKLRAFKMLL